MPLVSNDTRDIEAYIGEQLSAPLSFKPFASADKPTDAKYRYKSIYITDTSRPAWMDADGVWRYSDGTAV